MKQRFNLKIGFGAIVLIIISIVLYVTGKQIPQESIQNFLNATGPLAPVTFIAVYISNIIVAPINGLPFLIAAFYLFGNTSVFYVYIACVIGYALNFFIAKKWGRPVVAKLAGRDALSKIDKIETEYGLGMLIFMRLFLIGFGDFISYGYGLTPIKFKTFFIITCVAMIPSHVVWYFFALKTSSVEEFIAINIGVTWALTAVFIAFFYVWKNYKRILKKGFF